jgi:hypothetical protein
MVLFAMNYFLYFCAYTALLAGASPGPEAAAITAGLITPQSVTEVHNEAGNQALIHYEMRALAARQATKPGYAICYRGGICSLSSDLSCPLGGDTTEWYKCQCTGGRVAANAA